MEMKNACCETNLRSTVFWEADGRTGSLSHSMTAVMGALKGMLMMAQREQLPQGLDYSALRSLIPLFPTVLPVLPHLSSLPRFMGSSAPFIWLVIYGNPPPQCVLGKASSRIDG